MVTSQLVFVLQAAYLNGHDHVMALATDTQSPALNPTLYITTGAGSLAEVADSCGYERPNILYTSTVGGKPGSDCQVRNCVVVVCGK